MPEHFTKEIASKAKNIPLKVLQEHVKEVKARRKEDLCRALFQRDPEKLLNLANYHTMCKEKSLFLFGIKDLKIELKTIIDPLIHKQARDNEINFIVYFTGLNFDEKKNESYATLKIHSPPKKYKGEDPETLEPRQIELRKGFTIYLVIHFSENVIECKTKSSFKAEYARMALGKLFLNDLEAFNKISISPAKQLQLDHETRFKQAKISGLNFSGTSELTLKGEDVENTIETLKTNHHLDLRNIGDVNLLSGELSDKPIKFHPDGKITAKKTEDPYEFIKGLLP